MLEEEINPSIEEHRAPGNPEDPSITLIVEGMLNHLELEGEETSTESLAASEDEEGSNMLRSRISLKTTTMKK